MLQGLTGVRVVLFLRIINVIMKILSFYTCLLIAIEVVNNEKTNERAKEGEAGLHENKQ